jgi:hypothetical protein
LPLPFPLPGLGPLPIVPASTSAALASTCVESGDRDEGAVGLSDDMLSPHAAVTKAKPKTNAEIFTVCMTSPGEPG